MSTDPTYEQRMNDAMLDSFDEELEKMCIRDRGRSWRFVQPEMDGRRCKMAQNPVAGQGLR